MRFIEHFILGNPALKLVWGIYPRPRKPFRKLAVRMWPLLICAGTSIILTLLALWLSQYRNTPRFPSFPGASIFEHLKLFAQMSTHSFSALLGLLLCLRTGPAQEMERWKAELALTRLTPGQIRIAWISPDLTQVGLFALILAGVFAMGLATPLDRLDIHMPPVWAQFFYLFSVASLILIWQEFQMTRLWRTLVLLAFTLTSPMMLWNLEFPVFFHPGNPQLGTFNQVILPSITELELQSIGARLVALFILSVYAWRHWERRSDDSEYEKASETP